MSAYEKPLDGAGLAVVNEIVNGRLAGKQDALTGTTGQVVGFDADGNAVAQKNTAYEIVNPYALGVDFTEALKAGIGGQELSMVELSAGELLNKISAVVAAGKIPLLMIVLWTMGLVVPVSLVPGIKRTDELGAIFFRLCTTVGTDWLALSFWVDAYTTIVHNDMMGGGMTQEQADNRYLQLTGGTVTGALNVQTPTEDTHAATKGYVDDAVGVNLLAITFGEDCLGREYTVSAGDEVYTGTVDETLRSIVAVKQPNTEYYKITCGEISKKVVSGPLFGPMKNVNMFVFYKLLLGVANADWNTERAQLFVEQDGDVASPRVLTYDSVSGFFIGYLPTPGEWKITAKKFDIDYTQEFRGTSTVFIKDQKTILTIAPIWNKIS